MAFSVLTTKCDGRAVETGALAIDVIHFPAQMFEALICGNIVGKIKCPCVQLVWCGGVQGCSQEFSKGEQTRGSEGGMGTEVPSGVHGQNMETLENTNGAVTKIDLR